MPEPVPDRPVLPPPLIPAWLARRPGWMLGLWTAVLWLVQPLVFLRLFWKSLGLPAYRRRWGERLGFVPRRRADVWFHTVSVGEFNAALPLIRAWQARRPQDRVLVTATTPTGLQRVADCLGDTVLRAHFPQDLPGAQRRFLQRVRPGLAVFLETEIWPNAWHACGRAGVPLALINARLSSRSARGYARLAPLLRETFRHCRLLSCQTQTHLQHFRALGVEPGRAMVAGNLKYDLQLEQGLLQQAALWRRSQNRQRLLVFASTHEGEERLLIPAMQALKDESRLLVIVPRHPERAVSVCRRLAGQGLAARLESELGLPPHGLGREKLAGVEVLVVDRLGALLFWMAAADACFMGGSLVDVGGHNVLEPAALGKPVFTGPHVHNFQQIVEALEADGGLIRVADALELYQAMENLLADEAALQQAGMAGRNHVMAHRGAVKRTLDALLDCILPEVSHNGLP